MSQITIKVVIIPITKYSGNVHEIVMEKIYDVQKSLQKAGLRVKVDDRANLRPGAKYFEWERKGVPLRLDVGPRDVNSNVAILTVRNKINEKVIVSLSTETLTEQTLLALSNMSTLLLKDAKQRLSERTFVIDTYTEMKFMIESSEECQKGFYMVHWKCDDKNEAKIKDDCKATIRCYPNNCSLVPGKKCFYSGEPATHIAIFARAF